MDFTNEYYVRIYVRDTTTWKRLGWDGQAVLMQVLRKMDMAGILDIEDLEPWEAVVLHCGAPEDVSRKGIEACLRLGCLSHNGSQLVAPKYREANESQKSDAQRQREHRAREARDRASRNVTGGHEPKQNVTSGHECHADGHSQSQTVTVGHSFPSGSPSKTPSKTPSVAREGFNSSALTELFSSMRKAAGGSFYEQKRSDYDPLQAAVAWANAERPNDPRGACSESIARYLRERGDWCSGWPLSVWAKDPGRWLVAARSNGASESRTMSELTPAQKADLEAFERGVAR